MENLIIDEKLYMAPLRMEDASVIFETINQDRFYLRKWLPFVDYTYAVEDTKLYIKGVLRKSAYERRDDVFTLWYEGRFAGLIGFRDTDWGNCHTEIGYWLAEKMQKKGIAVRAAEKMIGFAFKNLNMNRVKIRCGVGNHQSAAIPKKLGFTFEGIEREGEKHKSFFIDLEVYSLLKSEWIRKSFF
ncbi:MAG: GNAT family protein [Bacteroidota bacterium]|nr:GNAT family protein [Bacteroidota bacterium]MDP4206050.1 GNAT family protein [Bacteroidota bacterium]